MAKRKADEQLRQQQREDQVPEKKIRLDIPENELSSTPTTPTESSDTITYSASDFGRRTGDLARELPVSDEIPESPEAVEYRRAQEEAAAVSTRTEVDDSMDDQSTQPHTDPRRNGATNSGLSEQEEADIFCILHPGSIAAHNAVLATMKHAPENILQNEDLLTEPFDEHDLASTSTATSRDIALRFSSKVKDPTMGFVFGRHSARCDVLLTSVQEEKHVSNRHFRIYLNKDGILMLQDQSTNGTIVDDNRLQIKGPPGSPSQNMLSGGSIISIIANRSEEIKFIVRLPSRVTENCNQAYLHNLRTYLSTMPWQGKSNFLALPSGVDHAHGMHWNGGPHYNITGQIGKGAFAIIYKLATKKDGMVFAAKELDKRRFMKNGILDLKVDNEVWIMRELRHPNIVQYIDYKDYDQWLYIIMEFVPGGDLGDYMRNYGALNESMAQTVAYQVLCALDYLHQRNVTHRDIKPDNILIASYEPLVVKLSDFGLSKVVQDETFLRTFCGTLLYCAPEVYPEYERYTAGDSKKRRRVGETAPKRKPYDSAVDMWSFGAVLFQLMSNKPPFEGRGDDRGAQMLKNIMTRDCDFDPLTNCQISDSGVDFVMRLLKRNPAQRPTKRECFRHPWIAHLAVNLPDTDTEFKEHPLTEPFPLDRIDEVKDEGDLGASQLQLDDDDEVVENTGYLVDTHDVGDAEAFLRQSKRQRREADFLGSEEIPPTPDVVYPSLPDFDDSAIAVPLALGTNQGPGRLFGEISASVLRSSGVFGQNDGPDVGIAALGSRDENVSVNDFVTTNEALPADDDVIQPSLQYPKTLPVPQKSGGSAPSLMGAEALVGQLNMGSPEGGGPSAASTPNTNNPATPKTPEATPEANESEATHTVQRTSIGGNALSPKRKRIDRRINLEHYSQLFGGSETNNQVVGQPESTIPNDSQLARTIDVRTGEEVSRSDAGRLSRRASLTARDNSWRSIDPRQPQAEAESSTAGNFAKPAKLFGKLTTVAGSIADITIRLTLRGTSFGRALECTVSYPDKQDTRIPKNALEVTLWAPDIENRIVKGDDWTKIPNIRAVLSTQARNGVLVNGKLLKKENVEEGCRLYGKLYTGDVIGVFKLPDAFLEFRCEFTYGESARIRPENEKPFVIAKEFEHHQAKKERESMKAISG